MVTLENLQNLKQGITLFKAPRRLIPGNSRGALKSIRLTPRKTLTAGLSSPWVLTLPRTLLVTAFAIWGLTLVAVVSPHSSVN